MEFMEVTERNPEESDSTMENYLPPPVTPFGFVRASLQCEIEFTKLFKESNIFMGRIAISNAFEKRRLLPRQYDPKEAVEEFNRISRTSWYEILIGVPLVEGMSEITAYLERHAPPFKSTDIYFVDGLAIGEGFSFYIKNEVVAIKLLSLTGEITMENGKRFQLNVDYSPYPLKALPQFMTHQIQIAKDIRSVFTRPQFEKYLDDLPRCLIDFQRVLSLRERQPDLDNLNRRRARSSAFALFSQSSSIFTPVRGPRIVNWQNGRTTRRPSSNPQSVVRSRRHPSALRPLSTPNLRSNISLDLFNVRQRARRVNPLIARERLEQQIISLTQDFQNISTAERPSNEMRET